MHQIWTRLTTTLSTAMLLVVAAARPGGLEPLDEHGGSRNSDEGFHIAGGAIIAGTITAAIAAFVADRLGLLQ